VEIFHSRLRRGHHHPPQPDRPPDSPPV